MEKSASIAELSKSLAKAQAEIQPAKMNSINPFLKNRYADLGEVIQAARGSLTKYGIAVAQHAFTTEHSVGIETILMHESGEWMSSFMELPLSQDERGRSLAQSAGSLITYLRRYTYAAIIGIYADEDVDGTGKQSTKATSPAVQKPAPDNGRAVDDEENAEPDFSQVVNSKGVKYIDLPTETLSHMANQMIATLNKGELTLEHQSELEVKLEAARQIIAARNGSK